MISLRNEITNFIKGEKNPNPVFCLFIDKDDMSDEYLEKFHDLSKELYSTCIHLQAVLNIIKSYKVSYYEGKSLSILSNDDKYLFLRTCEGNFLSTLRGYVKNCRVMVNITDFLKLMKEEDNMEREFLLEKVLEYNKKTPGNDFI